MGVHHPFDSTLLHAFGCIEQSGGGHFVGGA
jgi:hypothetical protein